MKRKLLIAIMVLTSNHFFAQETQFENSVFYINVFINQNNDVWVESDLIEVSNIKDEVKSIIYNHPFKLDEKIVYRVFADQNLPLGDIVEVEQELFQAYNDDAKRERYLLDIVTMNIDGSNWFQKVDDLKLKKSKV
jgi:hypothetical protein